MKYALTIETRYNEGMTGLIVHFTDTDGKIHEKKLAIDDPDLEKMTKAEFIDSIVQVINRYK